jgi:hypothetical protein
VACVVAVSSSLEHHVSETYLTCALQTWLEGWSAPERQVFGHPLVVCWVAVMCYHMLPRGPACALWQRSSITWWPARKSFCGYRGSSLHLGYRRGWLATSVASLQPQSMQGAWSQSTPYVLPFMYLLAGEDQQLS